MIIEKLKIIASSNDERTRILKKNIFLSIINKGLSVVISLLLVRLILEYIGKVDYGIWLTLSSIVGWASFFDFGITHGLRNKFAEAKAHGNIVLARQYVSTSYMVVGGLFTTLCLLLLVINQFVDWRHFLNLTSISNLEIRQVFNILIISFSLQFILNIITTIITADQRAAFAAFINTMGQLFALLVILLLVYTTKGSLSKITWAMTMTPCIVYLFFTFLMFRTRYRDFRPSVSSVNLNLIKDIFVLGSKFFIIQLSMIFVFQLINIIVIRVLGPQAVTVYNVSNKYFGIISMLMIIIITPFWSAFTDAYVKSDFEWMKRIYGKISRLWLFFVPLSALMLAVSPVVYKYWIGENVKIPFSLSAWMTIYMLFLTRANLSMYLINGTGKVLIQMVIYILFAVASIPLMVFFSRIFALNGLLIVLIAETLFQCIFGEIQIRKIINSKDSGLWAK